MATHVERSQVRREVATQRGQALIVTLTPEGIVIREKRRRRGFLLPYGAALQRAALLAAEAERRAKLEARRQQRLARAR